MAAAIACAGLSKRYSNGVLGLDAWRDRPT
jgi:hypothetical protein